MSEYSPTISHNDSIKIKSASLKSGGGGGDQRFVFTCIYHRSLVDRRRRRCNNNSSIDCNVYCICGCSTIIICHHQAELISAFSKRANGCLQRRRSTDQRRCGTCYFAPLVRHHRSVCIGSRPV